MDTVTSLPSSVRLIEGDARHFGDIDLIARLGHGGMAEVFLGAHRDRPGDLLVLKRLKEDLDDAEHRAMFEDEARIMPLLIHPNIVRTTEVGEQLGRRYLAMEYLDGLPLNQCGHRVTALGERAVLHVLTELLDGLHYAHELADAENRPLEIVHRDVSPQNVFVSYEGRVALVDFGIAKRRGRQEHTATGVVRGKLSYMAPEQALCDQVDRRADLFAAGVILWELLAGRRFWGDLSDVQILKRMTFGDIPRAADTGLALAPDLAAVLDKALAPKPEDRFANARELREKLRAFATRPFRRHDLGQAIALEAKPHRAAMRALVDAYLELVRGTSGLPGISTPSTPLTALLTPVPGSLKAVALDRHPVESGAEAPIMAAPLAIETEAAPASEARAPSEKPITETGSATTLELDATPIRPRKIRQLLGSVAIAGLALVAGAGVWLMTGGYKSPPPSPLREQEQVATPDAMVAIRLSVTPATATVELDGMKVDSLPLAASFPKDTVGHRIVVQADGYKSDSRIVMFERDMSLSIDLAPEAASTVPMGTALAAPVTTASAVPSSPPSTTAANHGPRNVSPPPSKSSAAPTPASTARPGGFIETDPWKKNGSPKKP